MASYEMSGFFLLLNMRISPKEIEIIKDLAIQNFGEGTKVFLFGSRIHNEKKGGDIDLLIRNLQKSKLTVASKIKFLVELKEMIGDQKIDVLLETLSFARKKYFYHSVTQSAVEL
jgi:predicted nucleotidyltransferase